MSDLHEGLRLARDDLDKIELDKRGSNSLEKSSINSLDQISYGILMRKRQSKGPSESQTQSAQEASRIADE